MTFGHPSTISVIRYFSPRMIGRGQFHQSRVIQKQIPPHLPHQNAFHAILSHLMGSVGIPFKGSITALGHRVMLHENLDVIESSVLF